MNKERYYFFLEKDKMKVIKEVAEEYDMSASAVIRLVLINWLKRGAKLEIKTD